MSQASAATRRAEGSTASPVVEAATATNTTAARLIWMVRDVRTSTCGRHRRSSSAEADSPTRLATGNTTAGPTPLTPPTLTTTATRPSATPDHWSGDRRSRHSAAPTAATSSGWAEHTRAAVPASTPAAVAEKRPPRNTT